MIYVPRGIKTSRNIIEGIIDYFNNNDYKLYGRVETFNNCREQGFLVNIFDNNMSDFVTIWAYEHRNSDNPTITYSFKRTYGVNGMYEEDDFQKNTQSFSTIESAVDYGVNIIRRKFEKE